MAKKQRQAQSQGDRSAEASIVSERWLPWLLAGISLLVFASGFQNRMLSMDDHSATVNNPAVTDWAFFSEFNLGMFAPLTWLGYAIVYQLLGEGSFGFHLLSALTHALNVWLVYKLMRELGFEKTVTGFIAFFFAIHPLQVEAVAWISGYSTVLYTTFCLLAMRYYVRYLREGSFGASYWATLGLFVAACLSKSAAVMLVPALFAIDWWLKREMDRKFWLDKLPFALLAFGFGVLTIISRQHSGHLDQPADFNLFDRVLMSCYTILFYWKKLLLPSGLSIWYPFEKANGVWPWTYYAAPVVLAGLTFFCWKKRSTYPVLWFGLLFYLCNIFLALPWETFGTFELRSDRYNYLPIIGLFSIVASLPEIFRQSKPTWVAPASIALVIAGAVWLLMAGLRIRDWKSTTSLIESAIEAEGDNFGKAYLWRGIIHADNEKYNEAIQDFNQAIQANPHLFEAYKQRGNLLGPMKSYEQAIQDLSYYLDNSDDSAPEYYNRGLSYINVGSDSLAIADFNRCLQINPKFERAYRARGNTYLKIGEKEEGDADLQEYERLLSLKKK